MAKLTEDWGFKGRYTNDGSSEWEQVKDRINALIAIPVVLIISILAVIISGDYKSDTLSFILVVTLGVVLMYIIQYRFGIVQSLFIFTLCLVFVLAIFPIIFIVLYHIISSCCNAWPFKTPITFLTALGIWLLISIVCSYIFADDFDFDVLRLPYSAIEKIRTIIAIIARISIPVILLIFIASIVINVNCFFWTDDRKEEYYQEAIKSARNDTLYTCEAAVKKFKKLGDYKKSKKYYEKGVEYISKKRKAGDDVIIIDDFITEILQDFSKIK